MIKGVVVKQLRVIPDERGSLMEILRFDDELFEKFGQVYMTTTYPGVVKVTVIRETRVSETAK